MKNLRDFKINNKRVLVRCDFNVPLDKKGNIKDDFKIKQTLPTIKYLIKNKAKVILMSHLAGNRSLDKIWEKVEEYLEPEVKEIGFLENLRLNKGEKSNENKFSRELSKLGDIYINDAFGVCHRAHASVVGVPKYLPSGAGFLLEKEIKTLSGILKNPKRPLVMIIGGAKIESKVKAIKKLLKKADYLLVGGKIAKECAKPSLAQACAKLGFAHSAHFYIPVDSKDGFDIGPKTIKDFSKIIKKGKTIFWAGPLGCFEKPKYKQGTEQVAKLIIKNKKAFKIAGGGDTLFALAKFGLRDKFDYVSTGGGAMLSFLSGEKLPGLKALGYGD